MLELAKALAEPGEDEAAPEDDMADAKVSAAQGLLDALAGKDPQAVADAFAHMASVCKEAGYDE